MIVEERMKNDYELKEIDFELIFIVDARCVQLMIVSSAIFFIYFFFSPHETKKRFKDARLMLKYYEFFSLFFQPVRVRRRKENPNRIIYHGWRNLFFFFNSKTCWNNFWWEYMLKKLFEIRWRLMQIFFFSKISA